MSNAQIAERKTLYRMIRALPNDKLASVFDYVRFLASDDEPPLSDDELAQIAAAEEDIAAGRVYPWEEVKRRLEALP